MRVFISADMEGATGVCHRDHLLAGGQDYEKARRWLTGDVNAAVEGAVAAGATEVVVADGHATMRNVLLDDLHPAASLVTGPATFRNRPLGQVTGFDDSFDAAMFVGHHTRANTPGGLLAHTWVGSLIHEIRIHGKPASESWLNAALFGHFGTPVVFASGADDYCEQVREELGADLAVAIVKETLGPSAVIALPPVRTRELIREAAAAGLEAGRAPTPTALPAVFELEFQRADACARALELGEGQPLDSRTLHFETASVLTGIQQLWRAIAHALREEPFFLK